MSSLTFNQEKFVYWVLEREKVRIAKESGQQAPWSLDPIMQVTYFCNVNREDDKTTRWIRSNWQFAKDVPNYTLDMFIARTFNLPSTLEAIGRHDNTHSWFDNLNGMLKAMRDHKKNIYNGAYMITTGGKQVDKINHFTTAFKNMVDKGDVVKGCRTLAAAHEMLLQCDCIGEFMSGQIIADLKNSPGHWLQSAKDRNTFSVAGPGSLRGLSWFWDKSITRKDYNSAIQDALDVIYLYLPDSILDVLCMQNLQNCFCEYDKLMRVLTGTGRSKRNYLKGTNE